MIDPALREAWDHMFRIVMGERDAFVGAAAKLRLTPSQAHLLLSLDPKEERPMSALAGALACDPSNVTGIVDRLEARGLIRRRASTEDRRVKRLALTSRGERLRARLMDRMVPPAGLGNLSATELQRLCSMLRVARGMSRA